MLFQKFYWRRNSSHLVPRSQTQAWGRLESPDARGPRKFRNSLYRIEPRHLALPLQQETSGASSCSAHRSTRARAPVAVRTPQPPSSLARSPAKSKGQRLPATPYVRTQRSNGSFLRLQLEKIHWLSGATARLLRVCRTGVVLLLSDGNRQLSELGNGNCRTVSAGQ